MFSERYNYSKKMILNECVSEALRNRVWNVFQSGIDAEIDCIFDTNYLEDLMDFFGLTYNKIYKTSDLQYNLQIFYDWFSDSKWYTVYDFIEAYLGFLEGENWKREIEHFNKILETEKSGYRIINGLAEPITNKGEIEIIKQAGSSPYQSVNEHIQKALEFYGDRKTPDYENSIKESISAVEAICCIINGRDTTLNKAIENLKNKGVHIHTAMEKAFVLLYAYTCDEKGIRHAGMDFVNASAEDAKYMLVSCSAFVNYLIEKWSKIKD